MFSEREVEIQRQVSELRAQLTNDKNSYISKINQLESGLSEKQASEKNLVELMEQLKHEKQKIEKDSRDKLSNETEGYTKQLNDLKENLIRSEERANDIERKMKSRDSESDKEKALFNQKIQQYEMQISELSQKERVSHLPILCVYFKSD